MVKLCNHILQLLFYNNHNNNSNYNNNNLTHITLFNNILSFAIQKPSTDRQYNNRLRLMYYNIYRKI